MDGMGVWECGWIDGRTHVRNGWMAGRLYGRTYARMVRCIDGRTDGWMDGWAGGRKDGMMNEFNTIHPAVQI
jgi:hypothetical protein